jgi:hypothetical protein
VYAKSPVATIEINTKTKEMYLEKHTCMLTNAKLHLRYFQSMLYVPAFKNMHVSSQGFPDDIDYIRENHFVFSNKGITTNAILFISTGELYIPLLKRRKEPWLKETYISNMEKSDEETLKGLEQKLISQLVFPQVIQYWEKGKPWWSKCEVLNGYPCGELKPVIEMKVIKWGSPEDKPPWGSKELVEEYIKNKNKTKEKTKK